MNYRCYWCDEVGEVRPDGTFECMNPDCRPRKIADKVSDETLRVMSGISLEIEHTSREVIEGQLTALNDKSKVAILCEEKDLDILIAALEDGPTGYDESDLMHADLLKLRKSAFGR